MSLICSLSNEVPEQPVLSPVSGCIYEKRLIIKYLHESPTDPVTGQPLTEDQLIEVKVTPLSKPKPPSATSIPAILKTLQDEWDATMLHSFTLRQQLQTARQELSHVMYQHDAACRVIARLNKEVTAAREALATLKPQAGISQTAQIYANDQPIQSAHLAAGEISQVSGTTAEGMTDEIIQKLQDKASVLTQLRKQRGKRVPEGLTTIEEMKDFRCSATHTALHSASNPGILALDISPKNPSIILTGGNDRQAVVFNKDSEQVVATLKGHQKKVTHVIHHFEEDIAITGSADSSIRVWHIPSAQCLKILKAHDTPITGLSLHPTGDYVLSSASDTYWALSDLRTGKLITKIQDATSQKGLTCAQFHPDGIIFGVGTQESVIKIWDLKECNNVADFPGHAGGISAIAFSENGYYLATAAQDASIKLWDLRKLKNFKTITLEDHYEVRDLVFDQSGMYLGVAGTDVRVYQAKQWDLLKVFNDHTALATGVRFGSNANYIASASMDRSLKFYQQLSQD
jgi:pre-mRNA-processing factor 19